MLISDFREVDRKAHHRNIKGRLINVKQTKVKTKERNNSLLIAGVSTLGISVAGFAALRGRYKANVGTHIAKITEYANNLNLDDYVDSKKLTPNSLITLVKPGVPFNRIDPSTKLLTKAITDLSTNPNRLIVKAPTDAFHTPNLGKLDPIAAPYVTLKSLVRGENPDALMSAAIIKKIKDTYGKDIPIQMIGHSGGGITFRESNYLLSKMGYSNISSMAIGSPNYGIIKTPKSHITLNNVFDPVASVNLDSSNIKTFKGSKGNHSISSYINNIEARKTLKKYLNTY